MDYDCQHFHQLKLTSLTKKGMLIGTSTICRQKQKHGFAHSLIPLKLINMCWKGLTKEGNTTPR